MSTTDNFRFLTDYAEHSTTDRLRLVYVIRNNVVGIYTVVFVVAEWEERERIRDLDREVGGKMRI